MQPSVSTEIPWTQIVLAVSSITSAFAALCSILMAFKIAKKQIRANVVATSRQRWIDAVRDDLAEFMTVLVTLRELERSIKAATGDDLRRGHAAAERRDLLLKRLELRLNPHERRHADLLEKLKGAAAPSSANAEKAVLADITVKAQDIFKWEWERVKKGE